MHVGKEYIHLASFNFIRLIYIISIQLIFYSRKPRNLFNDSQHHYVEITPILDRRSKPKLTGGHIVDRPIGGHIVDKQLTRFEPVYWEAEGGMYSNVSLLV